MVTLWLLFIACNQVELAELPAYHNLKLLLLLSDKRALLKYSTLVLKILLIQQSIPISENKGTDNVGQFNIQCLYSGIERRIYTYLDC